MYRNPKILKKIFPFQGGTCPHIAWTISVFFLGYTYLKKKLNPIQHFFLLRGPTSDMRTLKVKTMRMLYDTVRIYGIYGTHMKIF